MPSVIDIYNLALDAVGTRSTVASTTENSTEANTLNRHYTAAVQSLLASANWSFARQQATLALLNDATQGQTVPTPWLYEYSVPSNMVRMRYVMPMFDNLPGSVTPGASMAYFVGPPVRFVLSSDTDSSGNDINVILTNQNQAIAVYTKNVTNTALYTPQFIEGLRMYLGHRICMALTGDKQKSVELFQEANLLVKQARATNQDEGLTVDDHIPDWVRVRGYASDWAYPEGGFYYGPDNLVLVT